MESVAAEMMNSSVDPLELSIQVGVVDFSLGSLCWANLAVTPNLPKTLVMFLHVDLHTV